MPVYDFRCRACGTTTERRAAVETRSAVCPECGGDAQRQVASRIGFKIGKDGLLHVPGHACDGVGRVSPDRHRRVFGPGRLPATGGHGG